MVFLFAEDPAHYPVIFVLLSIVTGGFYGLYWLMCFEKTLRNDEKEIVPHYWFLGLAVIYFFLPQIFTPALLIFILALSIIYTIISILGIILYVYINIKLYDRARDVLAQAGSLYTMNKILAAIFGPIYFYYAIRRASLVSMPDAKAAS